MRLRHYLGFDGEPITLDGCGCDLDAPLCDDARCMMERDLEMRSHLAWFNHERRVRPEAFGGQTYAEEMVDAGRGHLLTMDEKMDYLLEGR